MFYERMNDTELNDYIKGWQDKVNNWRRELREAELCLHNAQDERSRRDAEAFWQTHPSLRLEVGDRLLVTEEAYAYLYPVERKHYRVGQVVEFRYIQIEPEYTKSYMHIDFTCIDCGAESGYGGSVSLDIARRMRVAWLQQQGETQL